MHKLSQEQYQAMLDALEEKGGVALADRPYVERVLFFSRWSASKLTGVGLELSDFCFCEEGEITLPKVEIREAQRQCFKRAVEVVEERLRYYEKTTPQQRQTDSLVVEYQQALGMMNNDMIELERLKEYYKRSYEQGKRENMRLRSLIAEYLGDSTNTDAVDNELNKRRYEQFQEAA